MYEHLESYWFLGKHNDEVLFAKKVWYNHCPDANELEIDLEEFVREMGDVYNYENNTKYAWDGEIVKGDDDNEDDYDIY